MATLPDPLIHVSLGLIIFGRATLSGRRRTSKSRQYRDDKRLRKTYSYDAAVPSDQS
ncbi:hypothetical protein PPBDW_I20218 [Photobacterium kishitanii]|nr:hypothetical protein PPBDW_I20218 [Photobacterium kishitanii]